jgi:multidrug transporter EmrE-like cation transporter
MTRHTLVMIVVSVLLNAAAQLLLKAGTRVLGVIDVRAGALADSAWDVATQPYVLGGLICYVLSVAIWIAALSRVDVSVAYPMLSLGYIVNALAAWALFGEALTPAKMAGILVILAGVVILARG